MNFLRLTVEFVEISVEDYTALRVGTVKGFNYLTKAFEFMLV